MKQTIEKVAKVGIPLSIAAVVLYFTYRDYDFRSFAETISTIKWWWILAALFFSALGPVFRGLRWVQLLEPIGYNVSRSRSSLIVFAGYAANIIVPRVGEISRCAVLDRHCGVPFSKGLGTLVAERFIDAILLGLICGTTILFQFDKFARLFSNADQTAQEVSEPAAQSGNPLLWIIVSCIAIAVLLLLWRKLNIGDRLKQFLKNFWDGFLALKKVKNIPLFLLWSVGIWVCYYFEMYLAFYAFAETAGVGALAGLVCFVAGSIAALFPTPNGAGPWHFVVIGMLMIYGVAEFHAQTLALVLHTAQTACYLLNGAIAWVILQLIGSKKGLNPKNS